MTDESTPQRRPLDFLHDFLQAEAARATQGALDIGERMSAIDAFQRWLAVWEYDEKTDTYLKRGGVSGGPSFVLLPAGIVRELGGIMESWFALYAAELRRARGDQAAKTISPADLVAILSVAASPVDPQFP